MLERRKTIRKLVNIPMNISLFETRQGEVTPIQVEGDIVDIAINGLCLEIKVHSDCIWETLKDYTPDKVFRMHLEVPSHGHKLVADGTVAWCRTNEFENKSIQFGMFLHRMEEATCEEWYCFVEKL
jgi:hypothetical protein